MENEINKKTKDHVERSSKQMEFMVTIIIRKTFVHSETFVHASERQRRSFQSLLTMKKSFQFQKGDVVYYFVLFIPFNRDVKSDFVKSI